MGGINSFTQLIVNLNAGVEIEVSSGESRIIQAGEAFLVEDLTGKGHRSKAINNQTRFSIFLPLEVSSVFLKEEEEEVRIQHTFVTNNKSLELFLVVMWFCTK